MNELKQFLNQKALESTKPQDEREEYGTRLANLTEYMAEYLLPTLIPALVGLIKTMEHEKNSDLPPADENSPFDQQSVALRVYLSRNVTPILNRGLEDTFRKKPMDPVEHLATFLFDRSSVEILDPEFDHVLNPLHWLAQYLYRHNPAANPQKPDGFNASPAVEVVGPYASYMLRPPTPTKPRNDRAPTPERIASPRTYPDDLEPFFPNVVSEDGSLDLNRQIIGRTVKDVTIGLETITLNVTAVQNISKKIVEYVAVNQATGERFVRCLNEAQLQTLEKAGERFRVSNVSIAQELFEKVTLTQNAKVMELGFEGFPSLRVSHRLYKGTTKIKNILYIVELRSESLTGVTAQALSFAEQVLVRASLYNPHTSETAYAMSQEFLSSQPEMLQKQVEELTNKLQLTWFEGREVASITLVNNADCRISGIRVKISVGLSTLGRAASVSAFVVVVRSEDEDKEACTLVPLEDVGLSLSTIPVIGKRYSLDSPKIDPIVGGLVLDETTFTLSYEGSSSKPETEKARVPISQRFRQARALDVAVSTVLQLDQLSSNLLQLSEDEIINRDRLWQMRRDQTIKRQKEEGKGIPVFRRIMIISGRYMFTTMELILESINGSLRFIVYDPRTCEEYAVVVKHRDTRGFLPTLSSNGNMLLRGEAERKAWSICKHLRLEKDTLKGTGKITLQLWEEDEVSTKLRRGFDQLDRDIRGRCTKADAISLIQIVQKDLSEFLASNKRLLQRTTLYLEKVLKNIQGSKEERLDFAAFHRFLSTA